MATDLENLAAIRSGYLQQLADEAAGKPGIDYSVNGRSESPSAWRASVWQAIKDIDEQMQARQPFVITTNQFT